MGKAFDKVRQDAIPKVMERFNIDVQLINLAKAAYNDPSFLVEEMGETSKKYKQETGIRQRCPLSPYLFLLVMAAIFEDVKEDIEEKVPEGEKPKRTER